jgi:O-antigen/teichoic acid export membrane protein
MWVLIETATSAVFSLLSMLVIGRVIGPEATGTGTIAMATFLLLDLIAAAIFTDALVQYPRLEARHARSAVTGSVLVGVLTALVLAGTAPALAHGADAPQVLGLCLALAPLLPLSAYAGAASGLALREHRFALLSMRVLLGQPLALAVALVLAQRGYGPWAMVANQVIATVASFLLLLVFGRPRLRPALDLAALRDLWPIAGPQIVAVVVMAGKYRIFLVALGFVVAEAVVAVSHFAFRMLDAALMMVWQSGTRIAMPRLCALQADRHALAEAFGDMAQLQALLGMPIAVGVAMTAPDLVKALLGPAWMASAEAVRIVGFAATLSFIHGDLTSLYVAIGKPRRNLQLALASAVLPLAMLLLVRPSTAPGVALCWAAPSLVMPPLIARMVLAEVGRPPLWLLRRIAPALLATAAMAASVYAAQHTMRLSAFDMLLVSTALGAAVYLGVAWAALGGRLPAALVRPSVPATL